MVHVGFTDCIVKAKLTDRSGMKSITWLSELSGAPPPPPDIASKNSVSEFGPQEPTPSRQIADTDGMTGATIAGVFSGAEVGRMRLSSNKGCEVIKGVK